MSNIVSSTDVLDLTIMLYQESLHLFFHFLLSVLIILSSLRTIFIANHFNYSVLLALNTLLQFPEVSWKQDFEPEWLVAENLDREFNVAM